MNLSIGQIAKVLLESSSDLICTISPEGGFLEVGAKFRHSLGYSEFDLSSLRLQDLVKQESSHSINQLLSQVAQGEIIIDHSVYLLTKGKNLLPVVLSIEALQDGSSFLFLARLAEPSEQPHLLPFEQGACTWHKALVENGVDLLALINEEGDFFYSGGGTEKLIGYLPSELVGLNVFEFIHPDDLPYALDCLQQVLVSGQISIPEARFKNKSGDWIWLETTCTNHLQNPAVKGLVLNSREITERRSSTFKLEESEQRFAALFENNPDMILIEKEDGTLLDANPAFLKVRGLESKQQVIGRHISEFLPAEVVPVCLEKLREAFAGHTVNYELKMPKNDGSEGCLSISKIPVVVDGKIVAVHTVIKDVTDIATAHQTITQQAEKLKTVLESITDAYYLLNQNWRFTFINKECDRMLGIGREELLGKNIWESFPAHVHDIFWEQYHKAASSGEAVYFETFLQSTNKWLGVKAFPSSEGLSVYFTDISDRIAAQQELEKLSLVASKTTNSVVITDSQGLIEWVNEGFTRMTGYLLAEVLGKRPGSFLQGEETDKETVSFISKKLEQAVPFNANLINYTKTGRQYWVSMDITPILDENGKTIRFIAIQKDISFRKEAEGRQLEMTKDLYQQNRDLQQFTYIVSHNLRAPVANALGLADLLTKIDKNSDTFHASLANLKKSVFKLDTVLRDLNMILSIRDKRDVLEQEQVDIADVCKQVYSNFEEALAQCSGNVQFDFQSGGSVLANRAYLYSIFYNLFSNAIKYRQETQKLKIKINVFGSPTHGTFVSFADNGTGFDLDKAGGDVFKLYKRFHKNKPGRGIGLFLVKTHIEAMNGKIEVSSALGKGTKFMFYLK